MLSRQEHGSHGSLLILLHWLGGSARSWNEAAEGLAARGYRVVAVDLPGFGLSNTETGYSVRAMADAVISAITTIRAVRPSGTTSAPWLLVGHSMGGKIAAVIARDAAGGAPGLENLRGLILASPSPPGPEPMAESQRQELLGSLGRSAGDAGKDRKNAETYLDGNLGKLPLPEGVRQRTVEDILFADRAAYRAWLEQGSKEDWSAHVGRLPFPALVFAGREEEALGPSAQREHTLPHLAAARDLVTLERAGHLAPLERPGELILRIADFAASVGAPADLPGHALGQRFRSLLHSDLTSAQTRAALDYRLQASTGPYAPQIFDTEQFLTLQALVECIIPRASFDLPACLDRTLDTTPRDGWRFSTLPPDPDAWRIGLRSLDAAAHHEQGVPFLALYPGQQGALLGEAAAGKLGKGLLGSLHLGPSATLFSGDQMRQWIEDVRGEITRIYVSDPRTLELMGFTGFADNGGFTEIRLGEREAFEP